METGRRRRSTLGRAIFATGVTIPMMLGAAAHAQNEGAVPDGGSASGPGTGSKIYDAAVLRPLGGIETLLGAAFYIATTPITLPLDQSEEAHDLFVVFPWDYTFDRSLGDF